MGVFYNSVIPRDGLVLHLVAGNSRSYPGTGTTWYDLSGNNNHGTLTNGPTYNSANGGSISFDGSNDYLVIGGPNIAQGNFLISQWLNITTFTGQYMAIFERSFNFSREPSLFINTSGNVSYFQIGGVTYSGNTSLGLQANKWHHLALSRLDSEVHFFLDGVFKLTLTGLNSYPSTSGNQWYIGNNPSGGGSNFHGLVGDFCVYNRTLSALEIRQIFNSTRRRFGV